jgi:hemoglobin/transferrin/lactoferrin receptor protein
MRFPWNPLPRHRLLAIAIASLFVARAAAAVPEPPAPSLDGGLEAPADGSPATIGADTDAVAATGKPAPTGARERRAGPRPRDRAKLPELTVTGQVLPDPLVAVERDQATDVRALFAREPAVEIGGGVRVGQRLYLRGIEGTNLDITIDGARQGRNLYNHRGGLGNIDPEFLKRVEVQPGPVAADQGHGALGGAIRFVTVDAQDRLAPGQPVGGVLKLQGASADDLRRSVIGSFVALGDHAGLVAYGSYGEYDDYRTGGGFRVPFSGGRDRSHLARLSLLDAAGHDLRIGIEHHLASGLNFMQRGDYPWQLQPVDLRARPPQRQNLRRHAKTVQWRYDGSPDWFDLELRGYDTRDDFFAPRSNGERFTSDGRGWDLRNTAVLAVGQWRWTLIAGADGLDERGLNQRNDRAPRANRYENLGLYLQNRFESGRLDLTAGVRRDDFTTRFRTTNRVDNAATLLNAGGRVRLGDGFALFGGYGEAARGAGTIPIHFAGNAVENLTFNGRVGGTLDSEFAKQSQLGLRSEASAIGEGLSVELVGFRTVIEDPILYLQPGSGGLGNRPVTGFFNAERAARWSGLELRGQWRLGAWSIDGGATRVRTRDLPAEPQFLARYGAPLGDRLTVSVDRALGAEWRFGYTLTAVDRARDVPANQIVFLPQPGYATHDLTLNWQPAALAGVEVALAIRNLTDRLYVRHTTFTQDGFATEEPGRDLRLTVAYRF